MKRLIRVFLVQFTLLGAAGAAQAQTDTAADLETRFQQAESYRRGVGVTRDLAQALTLHQALVADGHMPSHVRVALIEQRLGNAEAAIAAYEAAIDAGGGIYPETLFYSGHATGAFGALSRPDWGRERLQTIADASGASLPRLHLLQAQEASDGVTEQVLAGYRALADEGYSAAQSRLGRILTDGEGAAEADPESAVAYLRAAADDGNLFAGLWLVDALLANDEPEAAKEAADRAVESGVALAESRRAAWHADRAFGAVSDPQFGRAEIERLAEAGSVDAASTALRLHERRSTRINSLDLDGVLAMLGTAMENGDRQATGALARAYVEIRWLIPNHRQRHADLVAEYGDQLTPERLAAEQVQALYDPNDFNQSFPRVQDYLRTQSGASFASGLLRMRGLEIKGYVSVVQDELNTLGYGPCRVSGVLTQCSFNELRAFCRDEGIMDTCVHGPVTYPASRLIADSLGARRQP